MRLSLTGVISGVILVVLANTASYAHATPPPGCPVVAAATGTGGGTGDWEAVFGQRGSGSKAAVLLNRVRAKGFRCAVIEREQGAYEVAVIGLQTYSGALKTAKRARRLGLAAYVARS
jgi:hypothetical protein